MTLTTLPEGTTFSHGTMDCRTPEKTQKFLQEFLGIRSLRKAHNQYVWHGGRWMIACLSVGDNTPIRQGQGYRFGLLVGSAEEVDRAHDAAIAQREKWDIREVQPIVTSNKSRSFNLQDMNGNWWEIYYRAGHLYDDLFDNENVTMSDL